MTQVEILTEFEKKLNKLKDEFDDVIKYYHKLIIPMYNPEHDKLPNQKKYNESARIRYHLNVDESRKKARLNYHRLKIKSEKPDISDEEMNKLLEEIEERYQKKKNSKVIRIKEKPRQE